MKLVGRAYEGVEWLSGIFHDFDAIHTSHPLDGNETEDDFALGGESNPGKGPGPLLFRGSAQILAALEGHRMSDHHRKLINYSLEHLRFLEEQIARLDQDILEKIREAKLEPQLQLVQSVPGSAQTSAATVLAETGSDMQPFPSEKDLSSWAGLCPGNNRSAGNPIPSLDTPAAFSPPARDRLVAPMRSDR